MSAVNVYPQTRATRGAGFWVQTAALVVDFLVPTVIPTLIVFAVPAWGAIWVPLTLVLTWSYLAVFTARAERPGLGLWLFGLRVQRIDGGDAGLPLATYRSLLVMCSVALLGLGVIAIAFNANKQGWHDRMTNTIVRHC